MVSSAIGLNLQRGDQINVISMPFVDKAALAAEQGGGNAPRALYEFVPFIKLALLPLSGLLIYFMLIRPIIRTMRGEVQQHYKTVNEMEREERASALGDSDEDENLPPPAIDDEIVRIRKDVHQNQVPTAYIIKNWIQEG